MDLTGGMGGSLSPSSTVVGSGRVAFWCKMSISPLDKSLKSEAALSAVGIRCRNARRFVGGLLLQYLLVGAANADTAEVISITLISHRSSPHLKAQNRSRQNQNPVHRLQHPNRKCCWPQIFAVKIRNEAILCIFWIQGVQRHNHTLPNMRVNYRVWRWWQWQSDK